MGKRTPSRMGLEERQQADDAFRRKASSLTIVLVAEICAMGVWFSSSAAISSIRQDYRITSVDEALLTSLVQIGFVAGTAVSASLNLADRFDPRRIFAASSVVAALATTCLAFLPPIDASVLVLRFVVGASMAGVYPVGMRIVATWANGDLGLLIGLLVGALTLGSASPHLLGAAIELDWRAVYLAAAGFAGFAAMLIGFAGLGPRMARVTQIDGSRVAESWRRPALRLANIGYLGHMWELYAMWAWIGAFLTASFAQSLDPEAASLWSRVATFATVGIGAVGCLLAGVLADRWGRTTLTILAMAISGACALTVGLLFDAAPWLLMMVCLIWGISIVADSAQFSASVAELSDPTLTGTMLTLQTAMGFTLTLITIHLMPFWTEALGWHYAFMPLAIGPLLGVLAMARLRVHPDAVKLAGGRR